MGKRIGIVVVARALAPMLALAALSCVPPDLGTFTGRVGAVQIALTDPFAGSKFLGFEDRTIATAAIRLVNAANPALAVDCGSHAVSPPPPGTYPSLSIAVGMDLAGGAWNAYATGYSAAGEVVAFERFPFMVGIGTARDLSLRGGALWEGNGQFIADIGFPEQFVASPAPLLVLGGANDVSYSLTKDAATGRWHNASTTVPAGRYYLRLYLDGNTGHGEDFGCELAVFPAASGTPTAGKLDLVLSDGRWTAVGSIGALGGLAADIAPPSPPYYQDQSLSFSASPAGSYDYYWALDGVLLGIGTGNASVSFGPWVSQGGHTIAVLVKDNSTVPPRAGYRELAFTVLPPLAPPPTLNPGSSIPGSATPVTTPPTLAPSLPLMTTGGAVDAGLSTGDYVRAALAGPGSIIAAWPTYDGVADRWTIGVKSGSPGSWSGSRADTGIDCEHDFQVVKPSSAPALLIRAGWSGIDLYRRGASDAAWSPATPPQKFASGYVRYMAAAGAGDDVYLAYDEEAGGARQLRYTYSNDGGTTWAPPATLIADTGWRSGLAIACDPSTRRVAVVHDDDVGAGGTVLRLFASGAAGGGGPVEDKGMAVAVNGRERRSAVVWGPNLFVTLDDGSSLLGIQDAFAVPGTPQGDFRDILDPGGSPTGAIYAQTLGVRFLGGSLMPVLFGLDGAHSSSFTALSFDGSDFRQEFYDERGVKARSGGYAIVLDPSTAATTALYASAFFGLRERAWNGTMWTSYPSLPPAWPAPTANAGVYVVAGSLPLGFRPTLVPRADGTVALFSSPAGPPGLFDYLRLQRGSALACYEVPMTYDSAVAGALGNGENVFVSIGPSSPPTGFSMLRTTADLSWDRYSTVLSQGAQAPTVAADPAGNLFVGYGQSDGARSFYPRLCVSPAAAPDTWTMRVLDAIHPTTAPVKVATAGGAVYALYRDDDSKRLYLARSADFGQTVDVRLTPISSGDMSWQNEKFDFASGGGNIYVFAEGSLFRSADGGATWSALRLAGWTRGLALAARGDAVYAAWIEQGDWGLRLAKIDASTSAMTVTASFAAGPYAAYAPPAIALDSVGTDLYFAYSLEGGGGLACGWWSP